MTTLNSRADIWEPGMQVNVRHVMRMMRQEYRTGEIMVVAEWIDSLPIDQQRNAREIYRRLNNYLFSMLGYTGLIVDQDPVIAPLMKAPGNTTVLKEIIRSRYPTLGILLLARYAQMKTTEYIDLIIRSQFSHPLDTVKDTMVSYGLITPSQPPAGQEPAPYNKENIP